MPMRASVVVLCASLLINWTNGFSYEGYKLYEIVANDIIEMKYLRELEKQAGLNFLKEAYSLGEPNEVVVAPQYQKEIEKILKSIGLKYKIVVENVEEIMEAERRTFSLRPFMGLGDVTFRSFMFHHEMNAYLRRLAGQYPEITKLEHFGTSFEGRDMLLIRVSSGPSSNPDVPKPTIFIDAGIHAREWIAPPAALYIIHQLVENPANAALYQNVDWAIIPCLNPDGYQYTQDEERWWRKTRSVLPNSDCRGTDGNRNFDYYWMHAGASSTPCAETYAGPQAFSEPETVALKDWFFTNNGTVKLYLTFHSFGNLLLYPWGYDRIVPDDVGDLKYLGDLVAEAIYNANKLNSVYMVDTSALGLYEAAGTSADWAKAVGGSALSYTIELPLGSARYAFLNLASEILPIVQETWAGIEVFHSFIEERFWTNLTITTTTPSS
ncbi:carboxypeptidase B-like isoform X2 [Sitophilus oryzae]|uniref:Carboxypeptidase B-like isoform X2 n=1 Tax=Sitophilus oryzae TaxID=7048 RepID=A0A6J2XHT5_SITOR|nr:carboxypeptidase B-like isoform X2 [Sitophilus oryzae]